MGYLRKITLVIGVLVCSMQNYAQDTTQVLFIGNSITYYNNMPFTFENLANERGDTTKVTVYAPGGTGFVDHAYDKNVFDLIRKKKWDYIVLQPGSNESPGYSFGIDTTLLRARIIIDSIRFHSSCTKILFYEISYGVWGSSSANLATYNGTMDLIKSNLEYLSDSTSSYFAPVGEAFRYLWNKNQNQLLWGGVGDIHPNAEGSYLAACVFYSTIFSKPVLGTTVTNNLDTNLSLNFQKVSDSIVLQHKAKWRMGTYNNLADFNFIVSLDTLFCTNTSVNYDSVFWDFGDGNTSVLQNPVHIYSQQGQYKISLSTYKNSCVQSRFQDISITGNTKIENIDYEIDLFPNPTEGDITLALENIHSIEYEFVNMVGQVLTKRHKAVGNSIQISTPTKAGMYVLRIFISDKTVHRKILKY